MFIEEKSWTSPLGTYEQFPVSQVIFIMVPFSESYNTRLLSSVISNTHTHKYLCHNLLHYFEDLVVSSLSRAQLILISIHLKKKKAQVEKEQKKMGFLLDNYKKLQKKTEDRQKQEK